MWRKLSWYSSFSECIDLVIIWVIQKQNFLRITVYDKHSNLIAIRNYIRYCEPNYEWIETQLYIICQLTFIFMLISGRYFFEMCLYVRPNFFRFGSMEIFENAHFSIEIEHRFSIFWKYFKTISYTFRFIIFSLYQVFTWKTLRMIVKTQI